MTKSLLVLAAVAFGSQIGSAQTLRFEAASVKSASQTATAASRGGPGTGEPEQITHTKDSILRLLNLAYGYDWNQMEGPAWIGTEYYSIVAKIPPGTTQDQVRLMWQDLLAERFHLKFHTATKDFPVFELSVAKGGSKLQKTGEGAPKQMSGFPVVNEGQKMGIALLPDREVRLTFRECPMDYFASQLAWPVTRETASAWLGYFSPAKVTDKTGLTGTYNFTLEFWGGWQGGAFPLPPDDGASETGPEFFDALRDQLGLELTEKKTPLSVLVVDSVDRVPAEN